MNTTQDFQIGSTVIIKNSYDDSQMTARVESFIESSNEYKIQRHAIMSGYDYCYAHQLTPVPEELAHVKVISVERDDNETKIRFEAGSESVILTITPANIPFRSTTGDSEVKLFQVDIVHETSYGITHRESFLVDSMDMFLMMKLANEAYQKN